MRRLLLLIAAALFAFCIETPSLTSTQPVESKELVDQVTPENRHKEIGIREWPATLANQFRHAARDRAVARSLWPTFDRLKGAGSFRDFHKSFLNELRRSRHGIPVDFDSGKQICVPPVVSLRSRATQLDLHVVLPQVSKQFLVGIAGRHVPVGIVRPVV